MRSLSPRPQSDSTINPAPVILSGNGVPCSRLAHTRGIPSATLRLASFIIGSRSGRSLMIRRVIDVRRDDPSADACTDIRDDVGDDLLFSDAIQAHSH